jgi:hypothetical protein
MVHAAWSPPVQGHGLLAAWTGIGMHTAHLLQACCVGMQCQQAHVVRLSENVPRRPGGSITDLGRCHTHWVLGSVDSVALA